jgi:hypothetical protein
MSHERAIHVFGFLADFADVYPRMIEGDQRTYRDPARAAMSALADERLCSEMSMDKDIEKVINFVVRQELISERARSVKQVVRK